MGANTSNLSYAVVQELMKNTGFSQAEITHLYRMYREESNAKLKMTQQEFTNMYCKVRRKDGDKVEKGGES